MDSTSDTSIILNPTTHTIDIRSDDTDSNRIALLISFDVTIIFSKFNFGFWSILNVINKLSLNTINKTITKLNVFLFYLLLFLSLNRLT